MKHPACLAALAVAACTTTPADSGQATTANPIDVAGEFPTEVRRTTMVVRSVEDSLVFYRDALGLEVNYDTILPVNSVAFSKGQPGRTMRLVLLNGADPWIGWIGLMEYIDPPLPSEPIRPTELEVGSHIFVMSVKDADAQCAKAAAAPGARLAQEAGIAEYPGREGGPPIRVKGCQVWDADGMLVELNQRLEN
ncbi:MAG: hypothetical protein AAF719_08725 [Pseudomonadota bacterium]